MKFRAANETIRSKDQATADYRALSWKEYFLFEYAIRAIQGARSYQEDATALWIAPRLAHDRVGGEETGCGSVRGLSAEPTAGPIAGPIAGDETGAVFVLADGMGGHAGGALAAQTACSIFTKAFTAKNATVSERLSFGLASANAAIAAGVVADPAMTGMGCTLVGLALGADGINWISVGDSPLYLFSAGKLAVLNEDHSMAPVLDKMAKRGEITQEEAKSDRRRNFLRSAVSGEEIELIDLSSQSTPFEPGATLIIASDGIQTLELETIDRVIQATEPAGANAIAAALVQAVEAQFHPFQDNMTVIVLHALPVSEL